MRRGYKAIIVCLLLLFANYVSAQTILINWGNDSPPFNACQSTPVLNVDLAGLTNNVDYVVQIQVSNHFTISSIQNNACAGTLVDNGNGNYSFTVNISSGNSCSIELSLLLLCSDLINGSSYGNITSNLLDESLTYITSDNISNISIFRPAIAWSSNSCETSRQSYIGATESYTYFISAQNAPVQALQLHFELPNSIAPQPAVSITYPSNTTVTYIPDANNNLFIDLSPYGGLLPGLGNEIKIEVNYHVIACTENEQNEIIFTASIACYPNLIQNNCNEISCSVNFDVRQAGTLGSGVRWRPANTANSLEDFMVSVPVSPCDFIDFSYYFNITPNINFPVEAQTSDLNTFNFDINENLLDVGDWVLINGFQVEINGSSGICNTMQIGLVTRFNFNLDQVNFPQNWPLPIGNAGKKNAVKPGEPVVITFPNCRVNCNFLSECPNALPNITGSSETYLNCTDMCTQSTRILFMPIRNFFSVSSYLESQTTDLDYPNPNANSAVVNYHYDLTNISSYPWTYTNTNNSSTGQMFNCTNPNSNLVIELDPWLSLVPGSLAINDIPINYNYTPTVGQYEIVEIPLGASLPDGTVSFSVINDACVTNSFGTQWVRTRMESYCSSVGCEQVCPIVTGCDSIPFFVHCDGECTPGFPVGTENNGFHFRRYNFGMTDDFTDVNDGDFATAEASGFVLNRGYQCDQVAINVCGSTNSYFSSDNLEDIFFEIECPMGGDLNLNSFDFNSISGTFTLTPPPGCPNIVFPLSVQISSPDIEFIQNGTSDFVRIHLPQTVIPFDNLLDCNYTICLDATLNIATNDVTPLSNGFHTISLRGQFGSITSSLGTTLSCDSWGANFTILRVENTISAEGWDQIGNNFFDSDYGADCNNCLKKIVFETKTIGGFPDDDFPNEIRPVLKWPTQFTIDNLNNLEFSHAYYWVQENETYDGSLSGNNFLPVNSIDLGMGTIALSGIASSQTSVGPCSINQDGPQLTQSGLLFNNWAMVDKDNTTIQRLVVVFKDDCPTAEMPREVRIQGLFKDLPCEVDRPINYQFSNSDPDTTTDNMTLTIPNNVWTINSYNNPQPISVELRFNMFDSPPIPNAFIYIPGNMVSNLTVSQSSNSNCGLNVVNLGNGLWQFGSLCASSYHQGASFQNTFYTINLEINYQCEPSSGASPYEPIEIPIYYGYDCSQQLVDGSVLVTNNGGAMPCYHKMSLLTLIPQPSGIAVNVVPESIEVNACSNSGVDFVVTSIEEADIYNLEAEVSSGGLTISSVDVTYNNTTTSISGPFVGTFNLDLSNIIGGVFPGGHSIQNNDPSIGVHLNFEVPCSSGNYSFAFTATGNSSCSEPLESVNSIGIIVLGAQPSNIIPSWPANWSCGIVPNQVNFEISDILPQAISYTASMTLSSILSVTNSSPIITSSEVNGTNTTYYWNLVSPNTNETIQFDLGLPEGFCDSLNIVIEGITNREDSCWRNCSFNGNYSFLVCCDTCNASFTITQASNCCYWIEGQGGDSTNCSQYGFTIYNSSGSQVASYSGLGAINHCFNQNGVYTICYHYCCANGTAKDTCQTITVTGCQTYDCDDFDLKVTNDGCNYIFSAVLPPNFIGTDVSYCWSMGYNGQTICPGAQTVNFTYPDGTYQVCYKISYFNPALNKVITCKICKEIEVNCKKADEFCYVIERQATRDDGKVIIPLKSNGYLVGGEMTSANNRDMYFAHVKDDFTSDYNYILDESVNSISDLATVYSTLEVYPNVYILGGTTDLNGQNADIVLVCLNESAQNIIWTRRYGTPRMDIGSKLLQLNENTLVITGHTNFYNHDDKNFDLLAIRIDLNGALQDVAVYKPKDKDQYEISTDADIIPNSQGQFIIAGYNINSQGNRDMIALKVNSDFSPASNMAIVGDVLKDEWANGIAIQGTYFYLAGASGSIKNQDFHLYVAEMKMENFTQTNASRLYVPEYKTSVANKVLYANNTLLVAGDLLEQNTNSQVNHGTVLKLVCVPEDSKDLEVLWSVKTLKDQNVRFNHLSIYKDNNLLVTGTNNWYKKQQDIFVVNLDLKDGKGCCVEPIPFEKKLFAKYYSAGVSKQRPSFETKLYGKSSKYFKLIQICKEDSAIVTTSTPIATKGQGTVFSVFPNPNTGFFTIKMSKPENTIKSVAIFDMAGRMLFSRNYADGKFANSQQDIRADELSGGVYLIQVEALFGKATNLVSISK